MVLPQSPPEAACFSRALRLRDGLPRLPLLLSVLLISAEPVLAALSNGPSSDPDKSGSTDDGGGGGLAQTGTTGTTTAGGMYSMDVIGEQPVTVQLGAGFIAGCVIGVVVYTMGRISLRVYQRTREERRRAQTASGAEDPEDGRAMGLV